MKHNCAARAVSVAMSEFFGMTIDEICAEHKMSLATVQRVMKRKDYQSIQKLVFVRLAEQMVDSQPFVVPAGFDDAEKDYEPS